MMGIYNILEKPAEIADGLIGRILEKPEYKGISSMLRAFGFTEERNGTGIYFRDGVMSLLVGDDVTRILGDKSSSMKYEEAIKVIQEYKDLRDLLKEKGFEPIGNDGVFKRRSFTIEINKEPDSVSMMFGDPYPVLSEDDMDFHLEAGLEHDRFENDPKFNPIYDKQDYEMTVEMLKSL